MKNYVFIFTQYEAEFGDREVDFITPDEILSFLTKLTDGTKQSTKCNRYSSLKAFFNYIKNFIDCKSSKSWKTALTRPTSCVNNRCSGRNMAQTPPGVVLQVDPDNRLVADTLEAEWNEKLRQLQDAIDYYEDHRQKESEKLKSAQKKEVLKLAKDFTRQARL